MYSRTLSVENAGLQSQQNEEKKEGLFRKMSWTALVLGVLFWSVSVFFLTWVFTGTTLVRTNFLATNPVIGKIEKHQNQKIYDQINTYIEADSYYLVLIMIFGFFIMPTLCVLAMAIIYLVPMKSEFRSLILDRGFRMVKPTIAPIILVLQETTYGDMHLEYALGPMLKLKVHLEEIAWDGVIFQTFVYMSLVFGWLVIDYSNGVDIVEPRSKLRGVVYFISLILVICFWCFEFFHIQIKGFFATLMQDETDFYATYGDFWTLFQKLPGRHEWSYLFWFWVFCCAILPMVAISSRVLNQIVGSSWSKSLYRWTRIFYCFDAICLTFFFRFLSQSPQDRYFVEHEGAKICAQMPDKDGLCFASEITLVTGWYCVFAANLLYYSFDLYWLLTKCCSLCFGRREEEQENNDYYTPVRNEGEEGTKRDPTI